MQNLDWDIEIERGGSSIPVENAALISFRIVRADAEVSTFDFDLDNDPVIDIQRGDSLNFEIMNKQTIDSNLFSGEILETTIKRTQDGQILSISGKDYSHWFQRRLFTNTYTATSAHDIVIAILTDLVTEGIITTTGVEACTTKLDITFTDMTLLDCLKKVSDIVNFSFFLDTDHDFKWFAKDSKSSGITYTEDDLEDYSVKTNCDFIINDIWVLGDKCFDPDDQDAYTEEDLYLVNWNPITADSAVTKYDKYSFLAPVMGDYSIGCMSTGASISTYTFGYSISKDLTGEGYYEKFRAYVGTYVPSGIGILQAKLKMYAPDSSNYFELDITDVLGANEWRLVDVPIGEDSTGWTGYGSADWSNITQVVFSVTINAYIADWIVYVDNMYFYEGRYKYHGTDSGSFGTWGLRQGDPIVDDTISSDSEAEDRAKAIIALYKDPLTIIDTITTIEGDETLKPGYTIALVLPEITTTQRIKSITHLLSNGDYVNQIALAEPKRDYNLKIKGVDQNLGILKQRKSYPGPTFVGVTPTSTEPRVLAGNTFPANPYEGELFLKKDEYRMYLYTAGNWTVVIEAIGEGTAYPTTGLYVGMKFFRTDLGTLMEYNGFTFVPYQWGSNAIANNAITNLHLANDSVDWRNIVNEAIDAIKIQDYAINALKMANATITNAQIALNTITNVLILANTIDWTRLADEAVTSQKLASLAVTNVKIANLAVEEAAIADGAVAMDKIAANAIVSNKIASNAILADKIDANAIQSYHIAAGQVLTEALGADSVVANKIAAGVITGYHIAANSVQGSVITANTLYAYQAIIQETITANLIALNSLTENLIVTGCLNAANVIVPGSIIGELIAANAITANKIVLAGITANGFIDLGNLGAGNMDCIPNGAIYGRVDITDISAGHINLATCIGNLDDIANGISFGKVLLTQLSAGNIMLTAASVKNGDWYDESGVDINASYGITVYGSNTAFTTRATKGGTVQCRVDSAGRISAGAGAVLLDSSGMTVASGAVILDAGGITINGQNLLFVDENDAIQGYIYGISSNILQVLGTSGLGLNADNGIVSIGGDSISMLSFVDFWNIDVRNFVLELRTGDPAFPATGRIWFRTDL